MEKIEKREFLSRAIKSKVIAEGWSLENESEVIKILSECVMSKMLINFYKSSDFIL